MERGKLVHRRLRAVVLGRDLGEHGRVRPPGANDRELLLGDGDGLLHFLFGLEEGLVYHSGSCPITYLPRLLTAGVGILRPADQRADLLPAYCSHDVTLFHQVEDDNGQAVVHAQAHRRGVHELQFQAEHLTVVKLMEAHGIGHSARIRIVDPVHLRPLEERLGADLQRALGRTGVGGEEGSTKTGPEDDDPPLLQVADRPAGNVRLGHLPHRDRGLDPGVHTELLEHVLQREAVDHRAEHAHVVGPGPVDAALGQFPSAEHVPAADDRRDLDPVLDHGDDLIGDALDHGRGDAQRFVAGERLAGQLDHDPPPGAVRPVNGGAEHAWRAVPPVGAVIHEAASLVSGSPAAPQPAWPIWKRANARTVAPCSLSICLIVFFGSLTNGCSTSVTSLKNEPSRPSTILGIACSGLPSSLVICSAMRRSFSTMSAGTWSRVTYCGRIAATCWATSLPACSFGASSWPSTPTVGR